MVVHAITDSVHVRILCSVTNVDLNPLVFKKYIFIKNNLLKFAKVFEKKKNNMNKYEKLIFNNLFNPMRAVLILWMLGGLPVFLPSEGCAANCMERRVEPRC